MLLFSVEGVLANSCSACPVHRVAAEFAPVFRVRVPVG